MGRFTRSQFDKVTTEVLHPILVEENGFEFLRGVYFREVLSGIRQLLILDLALPKRAFFPIVGLNAKVIAGEIPPDEAGAYLSKYVTRGGLSQTPMAFRAFDTASSSRSLSELAEAFREHAMPWLSTHETHTDLARELPENYDFLKGKLFLADGHLGEARRCFLMYHARLQNMPQDEEVARALVETQQLLGQC